MFLDVAQNNDYDSPFSYDIYVNNKIKGKGKSKIKSGVTPSSQNIKNSLEGYYYFSHRQFDEDTIRVVISNIEKTDSLIDISFIVDEKDSIPMKSKTLSFENKTDETVYVGISAIRNKSDDLIFITDVAVPPQFKNSILIRPNLISPLLWNNYLEENFKTMYVVVFPHKKDLNIWKFNPNFNNPNSTDTYTISLNEFGSIIKLVYPKIIKEL